MEKISLDIETGDYAPAYSHLNDFEPFADALIEHHPFAWDDANESFSAFAEIQILRYDQDISALSTERFKSDLNQSIYSALRIDDCRHEHDCCGCIFGGVASITPSGKLGHYIVKLSGGRNY